MLSKELVGPTKKLEPIDWEKIYSTELFPTDKCWETCDAHCCKFTRVNQYFKLMHKTGVDLVLFPGEYDFLIKKGVLQDGFEDSHQRFDIKLPNGKGFAIDTVVCSLGGICSNHAYRPFICRLYPFIPDVEADGTITGFLNSSPNDLFWQPLRLVDPCTIRTDHAVATQDAMRQALKPALQYPLLIFSFKAAAIFLNNVKETVDSKYARYYEGGSESFFKKWEFLYLTHKAFNSEIVLNEIVKFYDAMKSYWGDDVFELRD